MMVFNQKTGLLEAILLDEGYLTDIRTAAAGAIAAKYLAPKVVRRIGIVGAGIQARLQLKYLAYITPCRDVLVWGRDQGELDAYIQDMTSAGFHIEVTLDAEQILRNCNLVVTATPSTKPILHEEDLLPGTHITAVGADTPHKQELDSRILARANLVVADSIVQCLDRGEIHQAIKADLLSKENLVERGDLIDGKSTARSNDDQITVADLTGVAVQDIAIAVALMKVLTKE